MQFTSGQHHDEGLVERTFDLGDNPGILWTPAATSEPAPLILI